MGDGWADDSYGNRSASSGGADFDFDEDDLDRLDPEARNELETLLFAQIHFASAVEAEVPETGRVEAMEDQLVTEASEKVDSGSSKNDDTEDILIGSSNEIPNASKPKKRKSVDL